MAPDVPRIIGQCASVRKSINLPGNSRRRDAFDAIRAQTARVLALSTMPLCAAFLHCSSRCHLIRQPSML